MAGTFLSDVPHWCVGVSALFPPSMHLWPVFSVCAFVARFLRPCVCDVSSVRASVAFLSSLRLWHFSSLRVSVAFLPSVRLWCFLRPCVCGVFSVCGSVAFPL